ncbi:hypothetical protein [Latilactobacillus curvatus]|uniref:hypothetical protein n=1 Tax=Latilactobacillus curvatus TaxID=28038 RepID=UPI001F492FB2|nr:hypothetical protein [Latilactobacillus curvatus]
MTTLIDLVYASPLFFLILFIGLQRFEKRQLINGIVFNFFLFSALMDAALIVIRLNNETLNNIAIAAAIVVVLIVMFGSYVKNPDIKVRTNLTFNLNYLI